ncbi:NADH-quinone oxidoreductase subunit NuoE [bacterium]|jgi:NADH:ubiquinone oxidoreductase subunit E|nr:NADH-quinone oxidoreductase subunit NuoE [bacterium]
MNNCRRIDPETLKQVANLAAQYKGREDMLVEVLGQVQKIACNSVPEEVISVISKEMGIPKAKVYSVATFYAFFSVQKRGKYVIRMCKSAPCHIKGAQEVLAAMEKFLGIKVGETTYDGKFTLETCECLGICDRSPAIMINDEVFGPLKPEDIEDLISKFE